MNHDGSGSSLDDMSYEDLLALAWDCGITDESDRDRVIECLRAGDITTTTAAVNNPDQAPSPPLLDISPIRSSALSLPDETPTLGDSGVASGSSASTVGYDVDAGDTGNVNDPMDFERVAFSQAPPTPSMAGAAATTSSSYSRGTTSPRFSSPPPPPPAAAGRNDLGVAGSEMGGSASTVAGAMGIAGLGGSGSEDYTGAAGGGDGGSTEQEVDLDLPEKLDKVATFVAITQQARSMAFQFLRATDWRLDAAINLFMESGGDTGAGAAAGSKLAAGARGGGGVRESVSARANDVATARSTFSADEVSGTPGGLGGPGVRGAGVARRYGGDGDNEYESNDEATPALQGADRRSSEGFLDESIPALAISSLAAEAAARAARSSAARRASSASGGDGGEAGADDPRYPNGYSEDGVRAPDSNRRDILIGGPDHPGMAGRGRLDAVHGSAGARSASMEEKDNTDWIFDAPNELLFTSSFVDTRQICKEQKKWLMVNIQDHEEFASHRLNKDVWSNETILTLLRGNFVFWQRNKIMRQARYYIQKYNLTGEVLPHTAIIDPRTGTQLLKVVGYAEPQDLSVALVEFLENNNLDQVKAPKLKTIGMGNIVHSEYTDNARGKQSSIPLDGSSVDGGGGRGAGSPGDASYNSFEPFESEEYVYDDDEYADGEIMHGSSIDGDDTHSRVSLASTNTSTAAAAGTSVNDASTNCSISPLPTSPESSRDIRPRRAGMETAGHESMEAETAHGVAELSGLWGSGTPEDETRALLQGGLVEGLLNVDGGEEETGEDVPAEPIAGPGVTQVRFRLPSGASPATIARRFWMQDRVSLLFQYVRKTVCMGGRGPSRSWLTSDGEKFCHTPQTFRRSEHFLGRHSSSTNVEDASTRPFDLLSGHPPASLSPIEHCTLQDASLSNSVIMVRWL